MRRGDGLGELGLADAGRALDEHRLAEPVGEVHDAGDARVGEVVDAAQALEDIGNGSNRSAMKSANS